MTSMDSVAQFMWDRLPLNDHAGSKAPKAPTLAEDWFVEDVIALGSRFRWRGVSQEESLRLLYRYAQVENHRRWAETGWYTRSPERLLIYQMDGINLPEALGGKA